MQYLKAVLVFILFYLSLYLGVGRYLFLSTSKVAEGTLVSYTDHGAKSFSPVFDFEVDKQTYRVKNPHFNRSSFEVGAKIPVVYSPKDPRIAEIKTEGFQYLTSLLFFIMGVFSLIMNRPYRYWLLARSSREKAVES